MNKNLIFCFLCFFVLCLASSSHQKHIRIRRQGLLFPDQLDTDERFGGQNRPNGNRPNGNRPNGNRPPNNGNNQQTTTSTTTSATPTRPNPECMLACLRTPEYNPVCGSNRQDYDNPSLLECARRCGLPNLRLLRIGRCPPLPAADE